MDSGKDLPRTVQQEVMIHYRDGTWMPLLCCRFGNLAGPVTRPCAERSHGCQEQQEYDQSVHLSEDGSVDQD